MKKIVILLFLLPLFLNAQTTFNLKYDFLSTREYGLSLVKNHENGYLLCGTIINDIELTTKCGLINTTCNGDTIWTKVLNVSSSVENAHKIQRASNSYFIAGEAINDTTDVLNYYLMKIDRFGDSLWTKYYGDSLESQCWDMIATSDGGFLMIGNVFLGYTVNGYIQAWLIKTDSLGNVEWEHKYGGVNADYAYGVRQTADGGYIVAGQTASFGAGETDMWLFKTDNVGNLLWQKTYGGSGSDWGGDVDITPDGGYVIVGDWEEGIYPIACIIKTDGLGDMQWRKAYGYNYFESFTKVKCLPDSGYIASGSINLNPSVGFQGWIARFNSLGDTLWVKIFGGPTYYNDYFYDLILTDDGGFAMAGVYTQTPSDYDMWLVKTDSNGCALPECNHACDACSYIEAAIAVSSDTIDLQFMDTIHFYAQSIYGSHWQWDFGDSQTDTLQNPLHTYNAIGTYIVRLIVQYSNCADTIYKTVEVINTVNTEQNKGNLHTIKLYPNPAYTKIQTNIPMQNVKATYFIYNYLGKKVDSGILNDKNTIDVSQLPSGFYFIQLENDWLGKFQKM